MLPSTPDYNYSDFPGWKKFLEHVYTDWEEASKSAMKLGITDRRSYTANYKKDKKLPSNPNSKYGNFPGWKKFLDTEFYSTWQEASKAATKLGVRTFRQYRKRYHEDKKLHSHLSTFYEDYPGDTIFFSRTK